MRQLRGMEIVSRGAQIQQLSSSRYLVKSQKNPDQSYRVAHTIDGPFCSCPDYLKRKLPCKHIFAVMFLLNLPNILQANLQAHALSSEPSAED
jgi:uncharacterized Zn finger protein